VLTSHAGTVELAVDLDAALDHAQHGSGAG
jgi:hypothetical protein